MRTHPLLALAVVAATITTVAAVGQSMPVPPLQPLKKAHHADAALDARQAASAAVPKWLIAPAASAASGASPAASAVRRPAADASPIERGRYLAAAGDCAGCHTTEGGVPYAGGRPLATPFGTVLSANLTPDATGLKGWNADQFYRAMHEGIAANGEHLYPAFPYNYFARMPRADTDALFAFLQSLPPAPHQLERNQLPFPFNIRSLVSVWNLLYLDKAEFKPDPAHDAQWNRGAYLVQGPGHCAACHTPKTVLGGPKDGHEFQGGAFGTWFAPDLTPNGRTGLGGWTREEVVQFLRTGRNAHALATGEMGLVVQDSTSLLADDDLQAIAAWLGDRATSPAASMTPPDTAVMRAGEAIFVDQCSACHLMRGQGQALAFPSLARSASLQQSDPTTALHIILAGAQAAPTHAQPTAFTMPAFAWKLDDRQVAAVATYVRNEWGNAAPAVTPDQVARLRGKLAFDARADSHTKATPMSRPGPNTLGTADTDSRDNGGAQAGRTAPASDAAASAPSSSSPGGDPAHSQGPG
jgi:mono/diheme cytochrome c family protein